MLSCGCKNACRCERVLIANSEETLLEFTVECPTIDGCKLDILELISSKFTVTHKCLSFPISSYASVIKIGRACCKVQIPFNYTPYKCCSGCEQNFRFTVSFTAKNKEGQVVNKILETGKFIVNFPE
jgi:hypothetical protein